MTLYVDVLAPWYKVTPVAITRVPQATTGCSFHFIFDFNFMCDGSNRRKKEFAAGITTFATRPSPVA
jgi:hypothetical protein